MNLYILLTVGSLYYNDPLRTFLTHDAIHQVEAITDCVIVEASNPVFDDRVRVPVVEGTT